MCHDFPIGKKNLTIFRVFHTVNKIPLKQKDQQATTLHVQTRSLIIMNMDIVVLIQVCINHSAAVNTL